MLITILGDDFSKKQKKLKEVLAGLKQKKPDANFIHYDFLDLDEKKLEESIETVGGLFEEKNIYLFSNIFFKNKKIKEIFLEKIEDISKSDNAFVLSLDNIEANEEKILKNNSFIFEKFSLPKINFDIFSLSNNLQLKNKKELWLNYNLALKANLADEQIFANLFFALKSLTLAEKFSEEESGLKTFPYKKAKSALKNKWKEKEAQKKLFQLISIYNQSRQSGLNLRNAMEKFILEL